MGIASPASWWLCQDHLIAAGPLLPHPEDISARQSPDKGSRHDLTSPAGRAAWRLLVRALGDAAQQCRRPRSLALVGTGHDALTKHLSSTDAFGTHAIKCHIGLIQTYIHIDENTIYNPRLHNLCKSFCQSV